MRGIQPVIYGMTMSSFIYFVLYKRIKEYLKLRMEISNVEKTSPDRQPAAPTSSSEGNYTVKKHSLLSVFIISAGASTLANF